MGLFNSITNAIYGNNIQEPKRGQVKRGHAKNKTQFKVNDRLPERIGDQEEINLNQWLIEENERLTKMQRKQ